MSKMTVTASLAVAMLLAFSLAHSADKQGASNIDVAEQFVSAFYSFKPEPLSALLNEAGESKQGMLFYQGWADGGNYIVMNRMPCEAIDDDTVRCSITVQDDLVLALGIDFDVTDTFTISFADGAISGVETSSNDPQLYLDARDWVMSNRLEWVEQPCKGIDAEPDPRQCARSMLKGYRDYARLNGLNPRAAAK